VINFVTQNRTDGNRAFYLSTNAPRRKFEESDMNVTLSEAELVPRGLMIVSYK